MTRGSKQARVRTDLPRRFEDLPNVGPAMAADLRLLGLRTPADLAGRDPYALYARLQVVTRSAQDPCVLDTFLAVVDYVGGAPRRPWWAYTAQRKRTLGTRRR
ncbi:MAG: helix-hairpin-helix domain-containing protein [Planctomycetes bacterium]|nr:helix-hairpin-helix domain-containing protein [Planctomycetota bacterium]